MGKPTLQQSYRDDPDQADDAVSMHTTPDDYDYAEPAPPADDLPSYTDSEAAAAAPVTTTPERITRMPVHGASQEPYRVIQSGSKHTRVRVFNKPVECNEVTIRMDDRLTDPTALEAYIMDYLRAVPPRPAVRIRGYHHETSYNKDKKETQQVDDFDILFSLQENLSRAFDAEWWAERLAEDGESVHRGSWRKTKAPGYKPGVQLSDEPQRSLRDWCEDYCASPSKLKVFRVNRLVHGIDQDLMKQQLENLVRSTYYRGNTDITIRYDEKAVDIYSPTLINQWRTNWVRYIFYFTFLWIITWPILFFATKWWNVYTVDWHFSKNEPAGSTRKKYASVSEAQWLEQRKDLIRELVIGRYRGDGDTQCASVSPPEAPGQQRHRQMPRSGNANVDSAVGFIQGGVNVWNALAGGRNPADQGWGYDT